MRVNRTFGSLLGMDNLTNPSIDNEYLCKTIEEILPEDMINDPDYSFTSDTVRGFDFLGGDNLHVDKRFDDLFKQIDFSILTYFKNMSFEKAEYYITKAWATYTKKATFISRHKHVASQYSFVYYVQAEPEIHSPLTFFEPVNGIHVPESIKWNDDNYKSIKIKPQTGLFIIFPSYIEHGTEKMPETDFARISISGDIVITAEVGVKSELLFSSPSTWRKLNGPITH
jgi:uncharacterized protein (TIGR02466 family)